MPGGAQVPSWSRDGKRILFYTNAEGTRQIWEVAATGGTPVQLTHGGSYDPSESPDGHYLYYGGVSSPGIWRIPLAPRLPDGSLANQDGELIRETLPAVTGHRFWTLGQGGIYFVDAQKTPAVLKFIDLASRKVTVVATLPKPPAKFTRGLSISPDGRYALYCEDDCGSVRNPRGGEFPLAEPAPNRVGLFPYRGSGSSGASRKRPVETNLEFRPRSRQLPVWTHLKGLLWIARVGRQAGS
jgi:Tol biopolymer transport system component